MRKFIDPDLIARTYRDPLAWLVLAVDLLPITAVLVYGWGATPLVALYWLENLVIGAFTIVRMLATGIGQIGNFLACLFLVPFFTLHYGMFCFVHGIFVRVFASMAGGGDDTDFSTPIELVRWALGSGQGMIWFVAAIVGVNAVLFLTDFIGKAQYRDDNPMAEMFAPYGRIITLHVAIILGAFIAFGTGQPLLGVILLIFLRVVFGVIVAARRRSGLDGDETLPATEFPQSA